MRYEGSCHCGTVKFSVEAPNSIEAVECDCSICAMTGFLHLIVPLDNFNVLSGEENLTTYTFNTGIAKHFFCKTCGIKPFYIPRSNPDGMDININCLSTRPETMSISKFNGKNWEDHAHTLAHMSKET